MNPIAPALRRLGGEIAELTAALGRRVDVTGLGVTDRRGQLALRPPGLRSPNGACRLVRAADGWIAVNLAREEDRELVPAWLGRLVGDDPWPAIATAVRRRARTGLVADAAVLGLPVAGVGEVAAGGLSPPLLKMAEGSPRRGRLRVVDLSALWAGPLCGAVLAEMGAQVVRIDSASRPDPTVASTPDFFRRLNGLKSDLRLDLTRAEGQARLRHEVLAADVVITSARPRAFAGLGLAPESVFAANPGLVWVAVTGYGWGEPLRVAFGDDAAAAGGLVRWTPAGAPRFAGDALADPVTGLAAAAAALRGLAAGGGVLVDAALARCAAGAAAAVRLDAAA